MKSNNSILFICPFWGQAGHVGTIRAERMVRWLRDAGYTISIVKAGHSDRKEQATFGELITIRDPLGMYGDTANNKIIASTSRNPSKLRRFLAYLLLLPDPSILWAKRVVQHKLVNDTAQNSNWFMASSPPESAFISASIMARHNQGRFWMDMRDGWLDEPMKPLLRKYAFQRFREKKLESALLKDAHMITVTSDNWRDMLSARYPQYEHKIHVITNTFPPDVSTESFVTKNESEPGVIPIYNLIHAGRIFSSRPERTIESLLGPLTEYFRSQQIKGTFTFIGDLSSDEEFQLKKWDRMLRNCNWSIHRIGQVSRAELFGKMKSAHGLLMFSTSFGSIPAKFYDYAVTGIPVLAVTRENSALQKASVGISGFHHLYTDQAEKSMTTISDFFTDIERVNKNAVLPERFTEKSVRENLLKLLNNGASDE